MVPRETNRTCTCINVPAVLLKSSHTPGTSTQLGGSKPRQWRLQRHSGAAFLLDELMRDMLQCPRDAATDAPAAAAVNTSRHDATAADTTGPSTVHQGHASQAGACHHAAGGESGCQDAHAPAGSQGQPQRNALQSERSSHAVDAGPRERDSAPLQSARAPKRRREPSSGGAGALEGNVEHSTRVGVACGEMGDAARADCDERAAYRAARKAERRRRRRLEGAA